MKKQRLAAMFLAGLLLLAGCSQGQTAISNAESTGASVTDSALDQANTAEKESTTQNKDNTVTANIAGTNQEISVAGNSKITGKYSERDLDSSWSQQEATTVTLSGTTAEVSGSGATVSDKTLTIHQAGTYVFSGSWNDGQIIVAAAETDKVQIVLNGVEITSQSGAVLDIRTADKVFLTLAEGTKNTFTDALSYADTTDSAADAAIYSKSDLTINGSGELTIHGQFKDGIKSKDELTITGGKLTINAKEDALTGKDSLAVKEGTFIITAGKDGLKASNTEDTGKGWISIDGGEFTINAEGDAIQAETVVEINDGTFDITSGGGAKTSAEAAQTITQVQPMPQSFNDGQRMNHPNGNMEPGSGQRPQGMPREQGQRPEGMPKAQEQRPAEQFGSQPQGNNGQTAVNPQQQTTANSDGESAKGVKAGTDLIIYGGKLTIDAADDALHSDGNLTISGGTLLLASDDDAIHAEEDTVINDSVKLSIKTSVEGIEGKNVTINGGEIDILSSDDAINATDGSPVGESAQAGVAITITGGTVTIRSGGDGLDSNGDIIVTGGITTITAGSGAGEGALDYNGRAQIKEGTVVVK